MLDLSLIDPKNCLIKVVATRENTANDVFIPAGYLLVGLLASK